MVQMAKNMQNVKNWRKWDRWQKKRIKNTRPMVKIRAQSDYSLTNYGQKPPKNSKFWKQLFFGVFFAIKNLKDIFA